MAYERKYTANLTDKERIALEWMVDHDAKDWIFIYKVSRDRSSSASESSIGSMASAWKNSKKIKNYVDQYRISSSALKEELAKRMADAKREKNKDGEIVEKYDKPIEDMLEECQREIVKLTDSKDKTQMQIKIIELKLRLEARNMGDDDQKIKRFYMDIRTDGCKNCALYQQQEQKIQKH